MAERIQIKKPAPQEQKAAPEVTVPTEREAEAQEAIDYAAELLDEIDSVLEENAEEFVRAYRQQGGE